MKLPVERYQASGRRLRKIQPWRYPAGWECRRVKGNGEISRKGKRRFIGEAFAGDYVGLQPVRAKVWKVYFGPILIGELREKETGNIPTKQGCLRWNLQGGWQGLCDPADHGG